MFTIMKYIYYPCYAFTCSHCFKIFFNNLQKKRETILICNIC